MEGLKINGNIKKINVLAAPEVIDFYKNGKFPEKQALEPVKEEKKEITNDGISVDISKFSHLKKKMVTTFVKALDPSMKEEKEKIFFDSKYEKEVKKYVNML